MKIGDFESKNTQTHSKENKKENMDRKNKRQLFDGERF